MAQKKKERNNDKIYIFHSTQRKQRGYFSMENRAITSLQALDFQILCYAISKPKNWKIIPSDVQEKLNISEHLWLKAIERLVKNGYVNRNRYKDNEGKFQVDYYFYESPEENKLFTDLK